MNTEFIMLIIAVLMVQIVMVGMVAIYAASVSRDDQIVMEKLIDALKEN